MNRIDVMVDIETLGNKPDSTIFMIVAKAFDINTGEILSSFKRTADITQNETYEMHVTGDTLVWWLNTNKELLTRILNNGKGSSTDILKDLHQYLTFQTLIGEVHLWGNGILFDNNMIKSQFDILDLEYPVKYNKDRDVRTILDLASAKTGYSEREIRLIYGRPELEAHEAENDVDSQIALVVKCYEILTKDVDEVAYLDEDVNTDGE